VKFQMRCVAAVASSLFLLPALSQAAAPKSGPYLKPPPAVDMGLASPTASVGIAVTLKPVNLAGLQSFVASTVDPKSPNFHKFLTPAQFAARYGQPAAVISRVRGYLQAQGLTVTKVYGNNLVLMAKGDNATLSRVFGTNIHNFSQSGLKFQQPVSAVNVPAEISDVVSSVHGLSTQTMFRSHLRTVPDGALPTRFSKGTGGATPATTPGHYLVGDFAAQYNVTPLYNRGTTGAGVTIGIMTFASFTQSDAYAYWTAAGLTVPANRITEVVVSDGAGGTVTTKNKKN
jgi:kumamolisin